MLEIRVLAAYCRTPVLLSQWLSDDVCGTQVTRALRAVLATDWAALPAIVWICLVYVAIAASALTFVALQFASLRLPAAKVMAYTYLVPSWVILWEIAFGRTAPPLAVLGGVALSVLALALLLKDEG